MSNIQKPNISNAFLIYLGTIAPSKEIQNKYNKKQGIILRNALKFKNFALNTFQTGKSGFKIGFAYGSLMGLGVGAYQSFKIKNIWPIPLCMLGSGFAMGGMFLISSIIKT